MKAHHKTFHWNFLAHANNCGRGTSSYSIFYAFFSKGFHLSFRQAYSNKLWNCCTPPLQTITIPIQQLPWVLTGDCCFATCICLKFLQTRTRTNNKNFFGGLWYVGCHANIGGGIVCYEIPAMISKGLTMYTFVSACGWLSENTESTKMFVKSIMNDGKRKRFSWDHAFQSVVVCRFVKALVTGEGVLKLFLSKK